MRITLEQIKAASQCLRYYEFSQDLVEVEEDEDLKIVKKVIQKAYRVAMETEWKVEWRKILGWVDYEIFREVDISDSKAFKRSKKRVEKLLKFLGKWHDTYLKEQKYIYTNFPLEASAKYSIIAGKAPILKIGKMPTVVYIGKIARLARELYNDIEIRGTLWLIAKALDVDKVEAKWIAMGVDGKYEESKIIMGRKQNKQTLKVINQISSLIELGFNYPSVTKMCNSCPFVPRCKL